MAESSVSHVRRPPVEATLDERRARVVSRFHELAATKQALRAELRASTDWRTLARRHPIWAVALAAGAGTLSAVVLRRAQRRAVVRLLGLVAAAAFRHYGRRFSRELDETEAG
jgi:hypothetical protein